MNNISNIMGMDRYNNNNNNNNNIALFPKQVGEWTDAETN